MAEAPEKMTPEMMVAFINKTRSNSRKSSKTNRDKFRSKGPRATSRRTNDVVNDNDESGLKEFIIREIMMSKRKSEFKKMSAWGTFLTSISRYLLVL